MANETFVLERASEDFDTGYRQFRSSHTFVSESHRDFFSGYMSDIVRGRRGLHELQYPQFVHEAARRQGLMVEAIAPGDLTYALLNDNIDRTLLAAYTNAPSMIESYTRQKVNLNLQPADAIAVDGAEGVLPVVPAGAPYPEASLSNTRYQIQVLKYGKIMRYTLEAIIQDGLNALGGTAARFAKAARRTQESVVTKAFATDAKITEIFTVGNGNIITGNPVFGLEGIVTGLQKMAQQVDADGQPININGAIVVYPSSLEGTALYLRKLIQTRTTSRSGSSGSETVVDNPLQGTVTLVPNERLPIDGGTNKLTGWYIFANPNAGRPALMTASLIGHESPDLLMKASNSVTIGGGAAPPMIGDFENDSLAYKVRMWTGVANIDPKSVYYSNGTAS